MCILWYDHTHIYLHLYPNNHKRPLTHDKDIYGPQIGRPFCEIKTDKIPFQCVRVFEEKSGIKVTKAVDAARTQGVRGCLAGQIISKSCSFSPETVFTPLILASKSEFPPPLKKPLNSPLPNHPPPAPPPLLQKSAYGPVMLYFYRHSRRILLPQLGKHNGLQSPRIC